ncbi:MAG TPA: MlaD family protein [Solirubrobacteraceae bacterium]|nr:MlaD family protein [Solirubrobacteraceae bacterium]
MRRILATGLVIAAAGAFALLAGGAKEGAGNPRYWIQLDNAFGLIEGADFKIGGVRAGKLTQMKLDRTNKKALVEFEVDKSAGEFSDLREDVYCETRPQSLIGEYFIDCQPGRGAKLKPGSTIPVERTFTTIPADLVNNILRLPQRERLRIILNEFGTGLAARGDDLNQAVRRGVPALRETDRLLAVLARQNQVIANLVRDGDAVVTALANNRENVGRFVVEARDTARASANRQAELAATFNRLPRFLAKLEPAMRELGRVADAQTPALRDLHASSGQLERFFDNLGPFAEASRPSFRSLGDASRIGRQAVTALRPTVAELRRFARHTPELGKNLAIVLEDLADRDRAVKKDPRAPGENTGWNGLENILGYVFWQSQAINVFDRNGYILKVAVYDNHCTRYWGIESVRADPEGHEHCASALGPTQPGINAPDTSNPPGSTARSTERINRDADVIDAARNAAGPVPQPGQGPASGAPGSQGPARPRPPIDLGRTIDQVLGGLNLPLPNAGGALDQTLPNNGVRPDTAGQLLDYLLGS